MMRRTDPRVPVDSLCSEVLGSDLRHALVVDLSPAGVRIQRPIGGPRTRLLQLELEVPETDELVWASAEICFDEVWRASSGIVRTSGVRILAAAERHRRMLREYVVESWRVLRRQAALDAGIASCLADAACYARG